MQVFIHVVFSALVVCKPQVICGVLALLSFIRAAKFPPKCPISRRVGGVLKTIRHPYDKSHTLNSACTCGLLVGGTTKWLDN